MSLKAKAIPEIPAETYRVAKVAFSKGNPSMTMRDVFGAIYDDELVEDMYPLRGQPALSAWRLALITIMQFAEGLSDRQAANRVRASIAWKYALSLELTDIGFDASVLSEFRTRRVTHGAEERLLRRMIAVFNAHELLKVRGKQRTDSTHILAAVRAMNRLECVGETLRYALNTLSTVCPAWLQTWVPVAWYERYKTRFEKERLPQSQTKQKELAEIIGADGEMLFQRLREAQFSSEIYSHDAIWVLRQVWLQNYYWDAHNDIHWRSDNDTPPAAQTIYSPYDPEARAGKKRRTIWLGYKAHMTETCDNNCPHLIVHVETTPATTPDHQVIDNIHQALAHQQLLPEDHLIDTGYVDALNIVTSQHAHEVDLIDPAMPDTQWPAQQQTGYDLSQFQLDWEQRHAVCPQGQTSRYWHENLNRYGDPVVTIRFSATACHPCPAQQACTRAKTHGRSLNVRPQAEYEALKRRRQRQVTDDFKTTYKKRAGVEGTISQGVRLCEMRRTRYLGLAKTLLQHVITASALNLIRVVEWLNDPHFAMTRKSRFARLAP